jgi:protein-tyrosine phosphatase
MPLSHKICHVPLTVPGRLFVMPRPHSGEIAEVADALEQRGVSELVCLLPLAELSELGLEREREACDACGIAFTHFPIVDFGLPEAAPFARLAGRLAADLRQGRSIVIHCRAGIGRTGMLACCVLVELGHEADDALRMVARARGVRVPDTAEQRSFITDYDSGADAC